VLTLTLPDPVLAEGERLAAILSHYARTVPRLDLVATEVEFDVPLPGRVTGASSSRYRFSGRFDGVTAEPMIAEFKLRGVLSSVEQVLLSRQTRLYSWAYWRLHGVYPEGVIVEEILNVAPGEPKILKSGQPSHDKRQAITVEAYLNACVRANETMSEETIDALRARVWHRRHTIRLTPREIREAGRQLVSAARLVGMLDRGELYPVRNPNPSRCPSCPFRAPCADHDPRFALELADAGVYELQPAKKDRPGRKAA